MGGIPPCDGEHAVYYGGVGTLVQPSGQTPIIQHDVGYLCREVGHGMWPVVALDL